MREYQRKSFIVYAEWEEFFEDVSDRQLAAVFKALFRYAADGTEPVLTGAARSIFRMMRNCLDRDGGKWEDTCRKKAENGRKGGLASAAKRAERAKQEDQANQANQANQAKQADNENENVNDNVNDNDNKSENENEKAGCAGPASPPRALGEYKNVYLSDEEASALSKELGEDVLNRAVSEISEYCASSGKSYRNWTAAIRRWIKRDSTPKPLPSPAPAVRPNWHSSQQESYDLDEWMKAALSGLENWEDQPEVSPSDQ